MSVAVVEEENPDNQSSNSFIKIEHIEGMYNLLVNEDNKIHIGYNAIENKINNDILDACFRIFPSTKEKLEKFLNKIDLEELYPYLLVYIAIRLFIGAEWCKEIDMYRHNVATEFQNKEMLIVNKPPGFLHSILSMFHTTSDTHKPSVKNNQPFVEYLSCSTFHKKIKNQLLAKLQKAETRNKGPNKNKYDEVRKIIREMYPYVDYAQMKENKEEIEKKDYSGKKIDFTRVLLQFTENETIGEPIDIDPNTEKTIQELKVNIDKYKKLKLEQEKKNVSNYLIQEEEKLEELQKELEKLQEEKLQEKKIKELQEKIQQAIKNKKGAINKLEKLEEALKVVTPNIKGGGWIKERLDNLSKEIQEGLAQKDWIEKERKYHTYILLLQKIQTELEFTKKYTMNNMITVLYVIVLTAFPNDILEEYGISFFKDFLCRISSREETSVVIEESKEEESDEQENYEKSKEEENDEESKEEKKHSETNTSENISVDKLHYMWNNYRIYRIYKEYSESIIDLIESLTNSEDTKKTYIVLQEKGKLLHDLITAITHRLELLSRYSLDAIREPSDTQNNNSINSYNVLQILECCIHIIYTYIEPLYKEEYNEILKKKLLAQKGDGGKGDGGKGDSRKQGIELPEFKSDKVKSGENEGDGREQGNELTTTIKNSKGGIDKNNKKTKDCCSKEVNKKEEKNEEKEIENIKKYIQDICNTIYRVKEKSKPTTPPTATLISTATPVAATPVAQAKSPTATPVAATPAQASSGDNDGAQQSLKSLESLKEIIQNDFIHKKIVKKKEDLQKILENIFIQKIIKKKLEKKTEN